jgi:DNA invertase Pin-like site-specific DNA recombinase
MGRSKGDQQVMSALAAKVAGIVSGTDQPTQRAARASRPRKQSTPAVAYMRCSGIGQVDGDTWDRQDASIRKYAAANGLAVADLDWFRDEGVSGTKDMGDRPGLAALLDRVESNGVRVVLVENATRLARDLMVSEVILAQLREAGCRVISCDSGHDLIDESDDDPTRRLIRQVLGAVAEFDRRVTVLKLRAARERIRRRAGRCEGRKPYGSRPGEAAVIARIRELHRKPHGGQRRSLQEIADVLNAENVTTRTGKPWSKGTLHQIIARGLKAPDGQE